MATVERFEDLDVWKRARVLANLIYDFSSSGEFAHDFGLRDQMRRAAVSVMSNIAEGFESRTQAMFIEYLGRAKASAGELRAQLYLTLDRNYTLPEQFAEASEMATICSKQIFKLSQYLEARPNSRRISEDGASYDV
ncbi:MAG: four helix bundle protein [Anaerolineales bacterium]